MGFVSAQIFYFDTVYGFAAAPEMEQRIFLHENRRVHPYGTQDGVRYANTPSRRHAKRGMTVLVKVESDDRDGFRAKEWCFEDDYHKAKRRVKKLRQSHLANDPRRRRPGRRSHSRGFGR